LKFKGLCRRVRQHHFLQQFAAPYVERGKMRRRGERGEMRTNNLPSGPTPSGRGRAALAEEGGGDAVSGGGAS
jgi:hypothetical protein